mmetsp:Transcript_6722/g.18832  ORF Transcript_6722/g.18832 Transcript_6722/m.18832 type:complete len:119 (-) Transcript_6722:783-1139(-)
MSTVVSNAGEKSPTDFPFVTVPYFEVAGYQARVVSGAQSFTYTPIVTGSDVEEWNKYSVENRGWLKESRDYLRNLPPRTDGAVGESTQDRGTRKYKDVHGESKTGSETQGVPQKPKDG